MTARPWIAGGLLVAAFVAGRALHPRQSGVAAERVQSVVGSRSDASRADASRVGSPRTARLLRELAVGLHALKPDNEFERRVVQTLHDSPEMRELRHEIQTKSIMRSAPSLPRTAVDQMVAVNDGFVEQRRADRAAFLLDEMTEEDYFQSIKDVTRESFARFRQILRPDDFEAVFHWRIDRDPFDPDGAIAQIEPPHEGESAPAVGEKVANGLPPPRRMP